MDKDTASVESYSETPLTADALVRSIEALPPREFARLRHLLEIPEIRGRGGIIETRIETRSW